MQTGEREKLRLDVWTRERTTVKWFWKRVWWDGNESQIYEAGCGWLKEGRRIRVVVE